MQRLERAPESARLPAAPGPASPAECGRPVRDSPDTLPHLTRHSLIIPPKCCTGCQQTSAGGRSLELVLGTHHRQGPWRRRHAAAVEVRRGVHAACMGDGALQGQPQAGLCAPRLRLLLRPGRPRRQPLRRAGGQVREARRRHAVHRIPRVLLQRPRSLRRVWPHRLPGMVQAHPVHLRLRAGLAILGSLRLWSREGREGTAPQQLLFMGPAATAAVRRMQRRVALLLRPVLLQVTHAPQGRRLPVAGWQRPHGGSVLTRPWPGLGAVLQLLPGCGGCMAAELLRRGRWRLPAHRWLLNWAWPRCLRDCRGVGGPHPRLGERRSQPRCAHFDGNSLHK